MAISDFTGQNIQDTYQRVVQTDGTSLADGTGSLLPISFDGNNVIISGSLTAQTYVVSESIINVSSGSTIFGNSSDDTHVFTGHITGSDRMTITSSGGNAKIILDDATGDPTVNFRLNGTQKSVIGYDQSTTYNKFVAGTSLSNNTGIVMNSSGDVGIGQEPQATFKLGVLGSIYARENVYATAAVQAEQ